MFFFLHNLIRTVSCDSTALPALFYILHEKMYVAYAYCKYSYAEVINSL